MEATTFEASYEMQRLTGISPERTVGSRNVS